MKTTITCTVDADVKEKVMPIIQGKLKTTISKLMNNMLIKILEDNKKNNSI